MAGLSRSVLFILACAAGSAHAGGELYPDFQKLSATLYQQMPSPAACQTGVLHEAQKQKVLTTLNAIRNLHGLAPVRYDDSEQDEVMQAALLMAANGRIDHAPPHHWRCWTSTAAKTAGASLLSGGVRAPNIAFHTPEQDMIVWLTDTEARSVAGIGHRRWLLDPFLKRIAYGRVSGAVDGRNQSVASVLKIMRPEKTATAASGPELIAYPFGDYPAQYYAESAPISVALMIDAEHKAANSAVDFSQARIQVKSAKGKPLRISSILTDNRFYGLPNSLQFRTGRLLAGERYEVTLEHVLVQGQPNNYRYWFRIVP
ncbi:MAG: hypothetical protein RIQ43_190 [Pseudomonadota bacterium]|jgi:uncharacterized protein YkwD